MRLFCDCCAPVVPASMVVEGKGKSRPSQDSCLPLFSRRSRVVGSVRLVYKCKCSSSTPSLRSGGSRQFRHGLAMNSFCSDGRLKLSIFAISPLLPRHMACFFSFSQGVQGDEFGLSPFAVVLPVSSHYQHRTLPRCRFVDETMC